MPPTDKPDPPAQSAHEAAQKASNPIFEGASAPEIARRVAEYVAAGSFQKAYVEGDNAKLLEDARRTFGEVERLISQLNEKTENAENSLLRETDIILSRLDREIAREHDALDSFLNRLQHKRAS